MLGVDAPPFLVNRFAPFAGRKFIPGAVGISEFGRLDGLLK